MQRRISRHWWLGLFGLVWLGATADSQAWERPPVKVSTVFEFRVDVKVGPDMMRPTAPWYTYFPSDARLMPSPQTSPFPPWPAPFPPAGPPPDLKKSSFTPPRDAPSPGPMLTQYRPSYYAYGSNLQPVAYVPAQAPSYWYQGR